MTTTDEHVNKLKSYLKPQAQGQVQAQGQQANTAPDDSVERFNAIVDEYKGQCSCVANGNPAQVISMAKKDFMEIAAKHNEMKLLLADMKDSKEMLMLKNFYFQRLTDALGSIDKLLSKYHV